MKRLVAFGLICALVLGCCGCEKQEGDVSVPTASVAVGKFGDIFSDRDLDGSYSNPQVLSLTETVTITAGGTYLLQGTLENGQIIVAAGDQDKVQLVLSGAHITCQNSAAIYIQSADKVFITLAQGTENSLTCPGEFIQTDANAVDAAVFSKADLTFNGSGTLTVTCAQGHGIVSKDDLKVTGGTYTVTAAGQGLSGQDSLSIAQGNFTIHSGTDGLQSKHDEDATKGNIYIADGIFAITAGTDGMDASNTLAILGGAFQIKTGGGSASATQNGNEWGGGMGRPGWGGSSSGSTDDGSYKALKAAVGILVSGGSFTIDAQDDAIHSNHTVLITGGELTISAGDDGVHADAILQITNGTIQILRSYEGLESAGITINGGQIDITASDDGLNAAGGNDGSGMGGPMGGDPFAADGSGIIITGGSLTVDAGGDGIDSNGNIAISGGTVFVDGPTNGGNGGMDYAASATVSGGTVMVLSSAGMAQNFSGDTQQGALMYQLGGTLAAGTRITLTDKDGKVLAEYTARKQFQCVVISAPGLKKGGTYTLTVGSQSYTITMESAAYSNAGGGMGPGGMMPGGPGGRPR